MPTGFTKVAGDSLTLPEALPIADALTPSTTTGARRVRMSLAGTCAACLLLVLIWNGYWPYTGEGDAMLHFMNARAAFGNPAEALAAWARPLYKLMIVLPAAWGIVPARAVAACITVALLWQTVRLAEDLHLRNPLLAAPLLLFQPLVFALAGDIMTELPFALGLTLALRLWIAGRFVSSCSVVSFLPLLRPEGFFIIPLWFLAVLLTKATLPRRARRVMLPCLGLGMFVWSAFSLLLTGNAFWHLIHFSWQMKSWETYGSGPIWHHAGLWPWYCGWVLCPLFVIGVIPSLRSRRPVMHLAWAAWLVVIGVHSILYWGAWFCSLGLMRIMVTTAPVSALICLYGVNALGTWLAARGVPVTLRRSGGAMLIGMAMLVACLRYQQDPQHHRCFHILKCTAYVRGTGLLDGAPMFFTGDWIPLAEFDYPFRETRVLGHADNAPEQRQRLAALPNGSIGIWDNQQAEQWYGVSIDELLPLGFEILYESSETRWEYPRQLLSRFPWTIQLQYVVVRKIAAMDAEGERL